METLERALKRTPERTKETTQGLYFSPDEAAIATKVCE